MENFERIVRHDKVPVSLPSTQNTRPDGLHLPIALLRSISRLRATNKRSKITANFLSAAMHIAFLRSAASKGLDDLPETAQDLMIQYVNPTAFLRPIFWWFQFLGTPPLLSLLRMIRNSSEHSIPQRWVWEVSATPSTLPLQYLLCSSCYQTICPKKASTGKHWLR